MALLKVYSCHVNSISYKFGIVAMMAGLIGVPLGSGLAQRLRLHYSSSDPQICAFGLIASAPFVYLGLVVAPFSTNWCFFFVFLAEVTLNLTWSIVADMLLVRTTHGLTLKRFAPSSWIMYAELFRRRRCHPNFELRIEMPLTDFYKKPNSPTPISPLLLYFQRLIYLWRHNHDSWNHWRALGQLLVNLVEQKKPSIRSVDLCIRPAY